MEKLLGIKKPNQTSKGNIGQIWIKQSEGKYKLEGFERYLPEFLIRKDLENGYLEIIE